MSALSELLAKAKARREAAAAPSTPSTVHTAATSAHQPAATVGIHGEAITYNEEQSSFISLATSSKSCILVGAAGTGKTTCTRGAITSLIQTGRIKQLPGSHKHLAEGSPGIVLCSYTRRAVGNLRKAMSADLKGNCITIHKLLEYQPVFYSVMDEVSGEEKQTMRFEATRNRYNPLPAAISTVVIDESSMVSTELFAEIIEALPDPSRVQFIFIGDIQQLPPVFGSAILGYKMQELPTVELTQVYRQALESPIIRLAHRILSGKQLPESEFSSWNYPDQLKIHPWKKRISADNALATLAAFFKNAYTSKVYDPEEDMILIPFNKAAGTIELNKHIATHISHSLQKEVHEVIAGFNKHYFSIGDKVLYEREDAVVVDISYNGLYAGAKPQASSPTLDYWGYDSSQHKEHHLKAENISEEEIDNMLAGMAASVSDGEDRVRQASHTLTLRIEETDTEVKVDTAAGINNLLLNYALTIHKSQGSEWRKVFLCLHQSHNTMVQSELLYTAVTRARQELYIICEPNHFEIGITRKRIPGITLADKIAHFKGKYADAQTQIQ